MTVSPETLAVIFDYIDTLSSIANNACCGPCLEAKQVARACLDRTLARLQAESLKTLMVENDN